jgi:uncharacterized membrane protein
MFESHRRSVAKAITWRVVAFVITVGVVWVVTGEPSSAAAIGIMDAVIKIFSYYLHERAWNRLRLGRVEAFNSSRIKEGSL